MSRSYWRWLRWLAGRPPVPAWRYAPRRPRSRQLFVELLETRDCPSGFNPQYVILPHAGATPFASAGPTGTTPAQVRHAYGFDQITFSNGTVPGDGRGTTIAIVDAYDDPNIANDLHQFDLRFGLPDPTFTKVNQNGGGTMPTADGGWASEIALDVEWAHAIAPKANILLVEAGDNSFSNLSAAVGYAARQPGVVAVSMSWGGSEFSGETSFDSTFQTPSGHQGVTFVASSGDNGAPASYPATSPNVLAVGGTTLRLDSSGNILGESAWGGSGGGISSVEGQPAYQRGVVTQTGSQRANPDVAYDADPNTGFPVYDSYNNPASAPWSQFGGTSDAAPQWAALVAIADQGRAAAGLGSLDGRTQTLPKLYALSTSDFNDVTSGGSTGSPAYSAGAGYDLATGRGSPVANRVVADLVGQAAAPVAATHFSVSAVSGGTAGSGFTVTVTALDANGTTVTGYAGTVRFSSSDPSAVLPANYTFTATDSGVHNFTVTLKSAGNQSVSAADTGNSSVAGTVSVTVNPASPSKLAFGQQPTDAVTGAAVSPAVTVRVLDPYGNLVTSDNTDKVTVSLGSNPSSAALGGSTTVTVSGGVATFGNLSVGKAGSGYTLKAVSGALAGATSASFNVTLAAAGKVIENFETAESWYVAGGTRISAYLASRAAHDGPYGLDDYNGGDWIYRNDAAAQLKPGDTVSVWLYFSGSADGRAYFGFGSNSGGTFSLVAAPNTGQLIIQQNVGFGFADVASVSQTYQANHWYRLEVDWGTFGNVMGKLFDSDGKTLLQAVSAAARDFTPGGFGFRATGSDKYWDTVTATYGVNAFATQPAPHAASGNNVLPTIGPSFAGFGAVQAWQSAVAHAIASWPTSAGSDGQPSWTGSWSFPAATPARAAAAGGLTVPGQGLADYAGLPPAPPGHSHHAPGWGESTAPWTDGGAWSF